MTTTAREANPMAGPSDRPTLDVAHLSIGYRRGHRTARVVDDVSFSIRPGEAYGLVGESGCGKTTVAMSLMRYLPGNAVVDGASRIAFDGADLLAADRDTLRDWRGNRISMVYQNPGSALNPSMTIGAQVAETYRAHGGLARTDALEAAREMLAKVRIPDPAGVLSRYAHQLSGGQQQRVMIAMALSVNPDLLVLDEPTTGLDATVEAEVLDLVESLRAEYRTAVLFISHNLGIVSRLCDRVGVLYAGRLVEQGPSAEVFGEPRHPYTLGLLRAAPRLGRTKKSGMLDAIPGSLPPIGADAPGCAFAPRCALAVDRCRTEAPALEPVAPGREARCFKEAEIHTLVPPARADSPATTTESEVLLEISNLTKRYRHGTREVTAVSDVSLHLNKGEVFGLVGESGSGKTTLAKCLVGMVDPTEGTIRFDDTELSVRNRRRQRGLRRRIQMVFQNPDTALNPRHSVGRILRRAVALLDDGAGSRTARARRAAQLAGSVRLEPRHLEARPAALSGGLKQRVAIARSFAGTPSLVICDEPVSALDVSVQAAILNLLVDLQYSKGVSYLFISHDMAVVRYIADRIGVMYLGQMVETGTTDAVFAPPHHPYTEALISAAPSLDAETARERIRLDSGTGTSHVPATGCRFEPRCPRSLGDVCRSQEPPWQQSDDGNRYRCHIAPDELLQIQLAPPPEPAVPAAGPVAEAS
jgi:peptide/nickel transport system ATP-binding protein